MNWKEFFRPTKKKFIILILLAIVLNLFPTRLHTIFTPYHDYYGRPDFSVGMRTGSHYKGFPLTIVDTFCGDIIAQPCHSNILYPDLIINLLFFYLFSCLIIFIFNKIKKSKKQKK